MAEISEKLTFTGTGFIDSRMQVDDLNVLKTSIPRAKRKIGMTVNVLNDGTNSGPRDYWLKSGTKDTNWVPKEMPADGGTINCGEY